MDPAVRLLAGGHPQIPKGDGAAPVQGYPAAMRTVAPRTWMLNLHGFTRPPLV